MDYRPQLIKNSTFNDFEIMPSHDFKIIYQFGEIEKFRPLKRLW